MSYIYRGEPEQRVFGPLPEGDYLFSVASCDEPYQKNDKWILSVKLFIQPQGVPVFANPWTGTTSGGEARDGIAEFLLAVNRAPKVGEEPDWQRLVGAKGKCRLKVEIANQGSLAGKEVNKVAWFMRPKQVGPAAAEQPRQASQAAIAKTIGAKDPDLDVEPDDIPF
jgi:hypothetical protein